MLVLRQLFYLDRVFVVENCVIVIPAHHAWHLASLPDEVLVALHLLALLVEAGELLEGLAVAETKVVGRLWQLYLLSDHINEAREVVVSLLATVDVLAGHDASLSAGVGKL